MKISRRVSYPLLLLSAAISIVWGSAIGLTHHTTTDFRAVYYATRCLLQDHNPYNATELERVLTEEHAVRSSESSQQYEAIALCVNLPASFIFVLPFSFLPFPLAQALWLALLAALFLLSGFLTWNLAQDFASGVSLFLICLVLANSLTLFSGGNTAGFAVSLCVISVWCFLRTRFVPIGVLCMALSLAIKPHDSGLVWLYFLLVGGIYRRFALQSLIGAAALGFSGALWVSRVTPHWIRDWQANINLAASHGHINDPGPNSVVGFHNLGPVISLQSVVSVFRDDPRFYNSITYLICGTLLLVWVILTLRQPFSNHRAWLALSAVTPLTMLVTYHHPWDAKLLLLTIPGCAIVWSQGGAKRWVALLITTASLASTGDFAMAIGMIVAPRLHVASSGIYGQIMTILLARPIPLTLFAAGAFYLWVYSRTVIRDTYEYEAAVAPHGYPDAPPASLRSVNRAFAEEIPEKEAR